MTTALFPDNVLEVLKEKFATVDGVTNVELRMIASTDPNGTLAMIADEWEPVDYEIGNFGPSIANYKLVLMHMVKSTDAAEGNKTHRLVAKALRLMLYRDAALRVALGQLREGVAPDPVERMLRWQVTTQRFGSTELTGQFTYLSVTELLIQTETV